MKQSCYQNEKMKWNNWRQKYVYFTCCPLQRKSRLMINLNKVTRCVVRGILRHGQRYLPVKLRIPPPNSLFSLHADHSRPPYTYPPRYLYILTLIHLYLYIYLLLYGYPGRQAGGRAGGRTREVEGHHRGAGADLCRDVWILEVIVETVFLQFMSMKATWVS